MFTGDGTSVTPFGQGVERYSQDVKPILSQSFGPRYLPKIVANNC
jgi:hypothetical protein